jgi:DNA polymerase III delta subunit
MSLEPLRRLLKAGKPPPVVLLQGPEEWMRRAGLDLISQALPDATLVRMTGEEIGWSRVADELLTDSLFAPRKIVALWDADESILSFAGPLAAYIESPRRENVLVLSSPSKRPVVKDHRNVLRVECEASAADLDRQIADRVSAAARSIEPAAARELARRLGDRREQWESHVDKLVAHSGSRERISLADVELLVPDEQGFQAFDLVNAISAGETRRSLEILHRLLDQGAVAQMLMGSLIWQYRKLAEVKRKIVAGHPPERACSMAGVKYRAQEFARMADKTREEHIVRSHQELLAADLALKSSGLGEEAILDRLVIGLTLRP